MPLDGGKTSDSQEVGLNEQQSRSLGAVFVAAYLLAGLYVASFSVGLFGLGYQPQLGAGNVMVYLLLAVPLGLSIAGVAAFARRRHYRPFLWASAVLWLLVSAPELLESSKIVPTRLAVVLMLVVSTACIGYLLLGRHRASSIS